MQRPLIPTPELVRQYIRKFDDGRDGLVDKALLELFRAFPENVRLEHILFKVLGLNAFHSTGNLVVPPLAKHILKLDIDARLAQSVPELVNEIAVTPVKEGKTIRYYSFATKYCSWHVPDGYPIFDSIVAKLIGEYQRLDKFTEDFWQNELARDYVRFKRTIEAFREKYGLAEFGFRNLDKFLWLYGKEFLGKTT